MIKPVSGFEVGKPPLVIYIGITDLLQLLKTETDKETKREKNGDSENERKRKSKPGNFSLEPVQ